jgi:4-diphosphocytidyl-2-C-methyl-D-erythritol kinase
MRIRRHDDLFELWTPAKVNLHLEILGKRPDGFHELETLMCPIDLYDTLYVRSEPSGRIRLECEQAGPSAGNNSAGNVSAPDDSTDSQLLSSGPDNLVHRALECVRQEAGVKLGATVRLVKRIPMAAGLAGGSSDAAAALVAAVGAWKLDFTARDLLRLAAQLGSDIAFFLSEGWAVCRGRGEIVQPVAGIGNLPLVVVSPPQGLATAEVFAAVGRTRQTQTHQSRSVAPLLAAVKSGHFTGIAQALHNRLQPVARRMSPWIARLEDEFDREGVDGHIMSGSGSSYFGLCRSAVHARGVARRLSARGLGKVFVVQSRD